MERVELAKTLLMLTKDVRRKVILEFLLDFRWYLAFDFHYKWLGRRCLCKIDPITFKNWIEKKWENELK